MKITVFTSNQYRHNYLINLLSEISEELFVVQECRTIFPGVVPGHYSASLIMEKYFHSYSPYQVWFCTSNCLSKN